jgi:superfamily II DNA or RNA helicase
VTAAPATVGAPGLPGPIALPAPQVLVRAVRDGRRLGLQLAFVEGASAKLKAAGASWFAPRRMWVVPDEPAVGIVAWLHATLGGLHVDVESAAAMLSLEMEPEPDYFAQMLDVQLFPLRGGGMALSAVYDAPMIAVMRRLGGRFHKPAQAWRLDVPAPSILEALHTHAGVRSDFVFVHEQEVVLEELATVKGNEIAIAVPAKSPPRGGSGGGDEQGSDFLSVLGENAHTVDVDEAQLVTMAGDAGLRDYQVAGVRHLASRTGACLGDDMGLGKTRQAVVAARLIAGRGRVLVLCPASLRINWEREIHAVFATAVVGMVGEDRIATLQGCDWVVANYERLGGLVRATELDFAVMLVDEAHYLKEHQAGRTRNAFIMASRIPRRYVITGTPLLNREVELHTLLRMTGHPLGTLALGEFRKQYSGAKDRRSDLAEALRGWMLRRRKDVLSELGAKHRQTRYISPAEGLSSYQAVMQDMSLMVMPKIVKLRQALEALKIDFIVETVQSLSDGDKVIVFAEYMASVNGLQAAFQGAGIGCVSLVGSDSGSKRQQAIDRFQSDSGTTVFIGTTSAAGVGITLTAANYVLFASLPWTPALMRQAEDRAYRLGQRRDVFVIVPLVAGTIDEQVWQLLSAKAALEQDVVEAVRASLPA